MPMMAGELGAPTVAKFIRVILMGTANKAVACSDKEIAGELSGKSKLEAKGKEENTAGKIQENIGQVKKVVGK